MLATALAIYTLAGIAVLSFGWLVWSVIGSGARPANVYANRERVRRCVAESLALCPTAAEREWRRYLAAPTPVRSVYHGRGVMVST